MQNINENEQVSIRGGLSAACAIGVGMAGFLALSGPEGWIALAEIGEAGGATALAAACAM